MKIFVWDPRLSYATDIRQNSLPEDIHKGFMYFAGELREVRDIHYLGRNIQIELF